MEKIIGWIVSILGGIFFIQLIILMLVVSSIEEFGRYHGWWGIPNNVVEVENVQFHDGGIYSSSESYVAGIIRNNYDKPIRTIIFSVKFYRCSVTSCNQIYPKQTRVAASYTVELGIPPHTQTNFRIRNDGYEYLDILTNDNVEPDTYIKYVPYVTNVGS